MNILNGFVNRGSDEALLKSLGLEDENLEKAIDKSKLVQVERQVQGKTKMFTRKQWVKPSQVQKTDKVIGGQQNLSDTKNQTDADGYKFGKGDKVMATVSSGTISAKVLSVDTDSHGVKVYTIQEDRLSHSTGSKYRVLEKQLKALAGQQKPHPTVNTSTSNHKQEFISALKGIQNQNTRDEFIRIYDNIDRIAAFTRNSKDKDRYFGRDRTKQQYFKDRIQNDIFNNIKWKDDLNFSSYKEVRQVITDTYKDYVQEFDETKNAVASNSKYTYKWNAADQLYDVLDSSGKVHTQASTKDEAEKIVKNNGAVNTKKTKDVPQIPPKKSTQFNNSLATPDKIGSLKKDSDSGETWYEGTINGHRARILQETVGKSDSWTIEMDSKSVKTDNDRVMTFSSVEDANDELEEQCKSKTDKPSKVSKQDKKDTPKTDKANYFKAEQATKDKVNEMSKNMGNDKLLEYAKQNGVTWKENDHKGINIMRMKMALAQAIQEGKVSDDMKSTDKFSDDTKSTKEILDEIGDYLDVHYNIDDPECFKIGDKFIAQPYLAATNPPDGCHYMKFSPDSDIDDVYSAKGTWVKDSVLIREFKKMKATKDKSDKDSSDFEYTYTTSKGETRTLKTLDGMRDKSSREIIKEIGVKDGIAIKAKDYSAVVAQLNKVQKANRELGGKGMHDFYQFSKAKGSLDSVHRFTAKNKRLWTDQNGKERTMSGIYGDFDVYINKISDGVFEVKQKDPMSGYTPD